MRIRITKEKVWKIVDWLMVPILGSLSYFFITEAWTDYRFGRTNISIDEVPLQEIPTMTMCLDDRKSSPRNWLSFQYIPHRIFYYKTHKTTLQLLESIELQEGENRLNGNETIILTKLQWCYSVTFKVQNFDEEHQSLRVVKIVFPKRSENEGKQSGQEPGRSENSQN